MNEKFWAKLEKAGELILVEKYCVRFWSKTTSLFRSRNGNKDELIEDQPDCTLAAGPCGVGRHSNFQLG